jgi:hypothetical protein
VRNGDVDDVEVRHLKKFVVIPGGQFHRGNLTKPLQELLLEVANRDQFDFDRDIIEYKPTAKGAGRLASH